MSRILMLGLLLSTFIGFGQRDKMSYEPGQVLVMLTDNDMVGQLEYEMRTINGVYTDFHRMRLLSKTGNIWQFEFDENLVSHEQILRTLDGLDMVVIAQNNHYVEMRSTYVPNDPNLGNQWHHIQGNDIDIDSDSAWAITTGGVTVQGDTIVVCVIEGGGSDWDHPDLIDNHWWNIHEIPGNSIDDDGNGYVDDVNGWNEPNGNDVISAGSHGTQVSGMIGAKADNNYEVAGINHDIKIMQVQMGSIGTSAQGEANVIAAYAYPLELRKQYNNTNGALGAYVVATNASWGIDNGDPNDAPLWCAYYDTLGVYGILNCGATSNSNIDVDANGDLPTACGSDHMISVTRTGNNDQQAGGYGATTIDLGAPGIDVVTTSNGGGSGATTGTSFSSPLTAGVIGLMYSAPCQSLISLSKANPEQAALQVRMALLNGTDPTSQLNGITVTGGRLNAYKAILEIINGCSASGCIDPWSLGASNVTDVQADLTWGGTGNSYNIRYREVGSSTWITATSATSPLNITGLTGCTDYEFEVQSICSSATDTSSYSYGTFSTDGCCEPPTGGMADNETDNTAEITWNSVLAATSYNLRYRVTGTTTWTDVNGVSSPYTLTGLTACTDYDFEIQTVCGGTNTTYSATFNGRTTGCGACEDLAYCASNSQNADDDWIETVEFNTINNNSGSDGGYGDYTTISTQVGQGSDYTLTVTPDYDYWFQLNVNVTAWIDWDQSGTFDAGEEVLGPVNTPADQAVSATVTIPGTAVLGHTRMRITIRESSNPVACEEDFPYGEVEDYCVEVGVTGINEQAVSFGLYPNPTTDGFYLYNEALNELRFEIHTVDGKLVQTGQTSQSEFFINSSNWEDAVYLITVIDEFGNKAVKRIVKK